MDWAIHHVNLPAHNVRESERFYREVLGLKNGPTPHTIQGAFGAFTMTGDNFALIGDGNRGFHLTKPSPAFARDNGLVVNPTISGHIAISVPDIAAVKKRLDEAGILYADAGDYAMGGVPQIYLYDPSMNCLEINQV